jgi:hypothetical protein
MRCNGKVFSKVKSFFRRSLMLTVLFGAVAGAPSASAVSFGFDLGFTSGALAGQTFSGLIETSEGDGFKSPIDGLISFNVTVGGITFTEFDDIDFPFFPIAGIFANELHAIDFLSDDFVDPSLSILLVPAGSLENLVRFVDTDGVLSEGRVTATYQASVPEPTAGIVSALAFLGLAGLGRQLRASARREATRG